MGVNPRAPHVIALLSRFRPSVDFGKSVESAPLSGFRWSAFGIPVENFVISIESQRHVTAPLRGVVTFLPVLQYTKIACNLYGNTVQYNQE